MKAAANIAHAQWLAEGSASSTSVTLEGVAIAMANGYPTAAGIMTAAQISSADYTISSGTVSVTGAPIPANCSVVYTAATSAGTPPVITAASVATATVTGC
jgi:MSHA pilin protein MshA